MELWRGYYSKVHMMMWCRRAVEAKILQRLKEEKQKTWCQTWDATWALRPIVAAVIVSVARVLRGCQGSIIKRGEFSCRLWILLSWFHGLRCVLWEWIAPFSLWDKKLCAQPREGEGGTQQIIAPLTLCRANSYTASMEALQTLHKETEK